MQARRGKIVALVVVTLLASLLGGSASATHSPTDIDGDGWADTIDNCPTVYNDRTLVHQFDSDADGIGNACDPTYSPNPGAWEVVFHFFDSAQEPVIPSTCATITVTQKIHNTQFNFDDTEVTGPTHVCLSNGGAYYIDSGVASDEISLLRTYEVDCDAGGVLTGTFPEGASTYFPVSTSCTLSGRHLWGVNNTPQTYGAPGGSFASNPTATRAEPVDTATGSYYTSATDLKLAGTGVPFTFTRSYNSADQTVGLLGQGWTDNLAASLTVQGNGDAVAKGPDGQQLHFAHEADGSFLPDIGGRSTLATIGGGYELISHDQLHYRFDGQGRLTSLLDRNGQGLAFTYDPSSGALAGATDSAGRAVTFTVVSGLLTDVALPDGRAVHYGYTGGQLTSVADAGGGTTQYSYDASGRLKTIVDQNNNTLVTNTYDPTSGRITDQLDGRGDHSTFAWDPATQTSTYTDARSKQWRDVYKNNVLMSQIDPLSHTTAYDYDENLNVKSVTDPNGNTVAMTYNNQGDLLTRNAPPPFTFQESFTYDALNDVKTYTDGRGNTTTYGYDTPGNLTSITAPDPDGTGPLAAPVTTITRDPAGTGRVTATRDPRLKTTQYGYDSQGNLSSVTTPLGNMTTLHSDSTGRIDFTVEPRGNVQGADPNQYKWQYTYNAFDELRTQTDPLGHSTTLNYYPDGSLQTRTDANGHTTNYAYWPSGQLRTVTGVDPDGGGPATAPVTSYAYDTAGNLLSRTDANQHVTTYGYDDASRLASVQTQLAKLWTYAYDANSNLTSVVDANGNATQTSGDGTTTYGYDHLNRVTSVTNSDAPTTPNVSFTYDEAGNRKTMNDGAGTANYNYDNLNRLTSVTRGTNTFSYSYDPAGNITQRIYPDTTALNYTFDDDGRLQTVSNTGVGPTSYGYDAASNLTTTILPSANGYVETRTYDRAGRGTEVKDAKGASTLSDFVQSFDPVGNPLTVTRSGSTSSTASYGYDNLDRLTSACFQASCPNGGDPKIAWTYDGVGNRLTETRAASASSYSYDSDDRLTQTSLTPGVNPYSTQVRVDGAQPYWRLGETSGSTFASSVGSFNGTWTGSPTLGVAGALNGDSDKAISLNGTSQYGTVANSSQLGQTTNLSLEAWVKRSKNAALQAIVGKPLTTTTKSENYGLWFETTNKIQFEVGAGNKSAVVTSPSALDTNWHHVVGTFASGALKLYIDGSLVASATASFTSASTTTGTLDIGRAGTTNFFGGSLDELALYGTALTATQVADHHTKGISAPPASTIASYGYDNDGRQTSAGSNTYTWNLSDRLTAATVLGATETYSYDGNGDRLSATTGGSTVNELWDANSTLPQLALERDGSNSLIRRYLIGIGAISVTTPSGSFFYHHDQLGSVSNVTNSAGATQWTYAYEPNGTISTATQNSQTAPANPLLYTGQYFDTTTNLYNLRARQYDPAIGRFASTDPAGVPMSDAEVAPYVYAGNNPTSYRDPTGLLKLSEFNPFSDDFGGKHNPIRFRFLSDPISVFLIGPIAPVPKHGTLGGCLGASGNIPYVQGRAEGCYVWSANQTGATLALGGGPSTSAIPSASVSASGQWSNAQCLSNLGKLFVGAGGSAAIGPGVTANGMTSPDGSVQTADVGAVISTPQAEAHAAATWTFVAPTSGTCRTGSNGK